MIGAPDLYKTTANSGNLRKTDDRMRLVGFFQTLDFIWRELDREGRDGIIQMVRFRCADNRGGDEWFGEHQAKAICAIGVRASATSLTR